MILKHENYNNIIKTTLTSSVFSLHFTTIRYFRDCAQYSVFLDRAQLLTQKLLTQCYVALRLKSSLQEIYGRHQIWLTFTKYPYLKC